jgi:hypothetical protein
LGFYIYSVLALLDFCIGFIECEQIIVVKYYNSYFFLSTGNICSDGLQEGGALPDDAPPGKHPLTKNFRGLALYWA